MSEEEPKNVITGSVQWFSEISAILKELKHGGLATRIDDKIAKLGSRSPGYGGSTTIYLDAADMKRLEEAYSIWDRRKGAGIAYEEAVGSKHLNGTYRSR